MNATNDRFALITGASSGIGREFARILARDGFSLVLVARSHHELSALAEDFKNRFGTATLLLPVDLRNHSGAEEIMAALCEHQIELEILINNAGIGSYGEFSSADVRSQLEIIQINVVALTHLTRLILPGMIARGRGIILNVSSTAAYAPGPTMAVYYASKAFVSSFSRAICEEVRGTGVTVTTLCPGPTRTNFQSNAGMRKSIQLQKFNMMTAERVATLGIRGMLAGKRLVIPGFINQILAVGSRFVPLSLSLALIKRLHRVNVEQT